MGLFPAEAELSFLDPDVPRWKTLLADEKRLATTMMEVYLGFFEHADHHHLLRYEFDPQTPQDLSQGRGAGGLGQLYLDGNLMTQTLLHTMLPIVFGLDGLSCGYDFGEAVNEAYSALFRFRGEIHEVVVELGGELIVDEEGETRRLTARQ